MTPEPWRTVPGGLEIAVRVTPRAGRTMLTGVSADAQDRALLHIRLAAPPVEGAANDALTAFLTDLLAVRKRDVTIRSGQASRTKIVEVAGDVARLAERLRSALALSPGR